MLPGRLVAEQTGDSACRPEGRLTPLKHVLPRVASSCMCEGQCHGLQCQGCKNSTKLSSVVSFFDNDQNYRPLFQKRSVSTLMWTIKSVSQPRRLVWVHLQPQGGHDAYATGQARDVASPHGHHVAHLPPPGPRGTAVGVLQVFTNVSGMSTADELKLRQPDSQ